jgi:hypothetical protein
VTERITLFSNPPTLAEIQAHFDAHPELWDKNHPEFGKGPRYVDYISLLPLPKLTPEEEVVHRKIRERLKEFSRQYSISLVLPTRY